MHPTPDPFAASTVRAALDRQYLHAETTRRGTRRNPLVEKRSTRPQTVSNAVEAASQHYSAKHTNKARAKAARAHYGTN